MMHMRRKKLRQKYYPLSGIANQSLEVTILEDSQHSSILKKEIFHQCCDLWIKRSQKRVHSSAEENAKLKIDMKYFKIRLSYGST